MPIKASNPQKRSRKKAKSTSRTHAALRATGGRKGGAAAIGASEKQRSQGRFPGETPLTGEDRPSDRPGGKKRGQTARMGDRGR